MDHIIILAGGKGKRMNNDSPKVLTEVLGKPMIFRLLEKTKTVCYLPTVVTGFGSDKVVEKIGKRAEYILQSKQLGTGHAVYCAKEKLEKENFENIVILPGDHPLVTTETIENMILSHKKSGAVLTLSYVKVQDFEGVYSCFYSCGRVIRDEMGNVTGIVELKDANDKQLEIKELNVSYYCFSAKWLWGNIEKLDNNNASKEYYLTDLIEIAVRQKEKINDFLINNPIEGMGVNTPEQKKIIENVLE